MSLGVKVASVVLQSELWPWPSKLTFFLLPPLPSPDLSSKQWGQCQWLHQVCATGPEAVSFHSFPFTRASMCILRDSIHIRRELKPEWQWKQMGLWLEAVDLCLKKNSWLAFFFLFIYLFFNLWLCWVFVAAQAFSSCGEQGLLFVVVCGLLIEVASLVAEHRL